MKSFNIFIVMCALCLLCAALPVRVITNDNSLIDLWSSSLGTKLSSSVDDKVLKRGTRNVIYSGCAEKQFSFSGQCMTCEEYEKFFEGDGCPLDNEIKTNSE